MHGMKFIFIFILQDKKKKMVLCVLVRWDLRLGISNVKTLIWIATKLNLLMHGFWDGSKHPKSQGPQIAPIQKIRTQFCEHGHKDIEVTIW